MKIFLYPVLLAVLFTSCRSQFPIVYNTEKAKDPQYESYVKTKRGDIYTGASIEKQNESKLFKPTLFVIADTAIKAKDVAEYQDQSGSYRRLAGELTKALTGPHLLVYKQEYIYQTYDAPSMGVSGLGRTRTNHSVRYYLQKKGQDEVVLVGLKTSKQLMEWVEDYDEAYQQAVLADTYVKRIKMHRLIGWGAILGGAALMMSDPASNPSVNPNAKFGVVGYSGLTLFSGGIVNLCLNLSRRGKAGRAYAEAINLYNEKPVKGKK
jgi:hypothetical protein